MVHIRKQQEHESDDAIPCAQGYEADTRSSHRDEVCMDGHEGGVLPCSRLAVRPVQQAPLHRPADQLGRLLVHAHGHELLHEGCCTLALFRIASRWMGVRQLRQQSCAIVWPRSEHVPDSANAALHLDMQEVNSGVMPKKNPHLKGIEQVFGETILARNFWPQAGPSALLPFHTQEFIPSCTR